MHAKLLQSCPTLCDPIDGSPPGSSIPGTLQARMLERVAISFSIACMHAKLLQSCPTLCDPMDSSSPGSSVSGILQARYWSGLPFPSPMHVYMLSCFSRVRLSANPWTAAKQRPLSSPSIFSSIRVFCNESALCIRWPEYWRTCCCCCCCC